MTAEELSEIVDQRMTDPIVLGRLACNLRSHVPMKQRHHDDQELSVVWEDEGDFWRCTVMANTGPLAQIDLHENATVRIDAFDSVRVTVSPEEGILCLTRYKRMA